MKLVDVPYSSCTSTHIRGLSGNFVDMACFHSFLYIFQTRLTYYDSVTPE